MKQQQQAKSGFGADLEQAWSWRDRGGFLEGSDCVRLFHGPGDALSHRAGRELAVDRYGAHAWVTEWEGEGRGLRERPEDLSVLRGFLKAKKFESAVVVHRPQKAIAHEPEVLFGEVARDGFTASEGPMRFRIRMHELKHPGLFLDHAPLRRWLLSHARVSSALNTFSYTGSLSIAAALGGAEKVTTLDLSKPTIRWAEENWELNDLAPERGEFIAGDIFQRIPRWVGQGRRFGMIILDPPSFSRGEKGVFSTQKDLPRLHELALSALEPGGLLVTSINSANIPVERFLVEVNAAARARKQRVRVLRMIEQPETFGTLLGAPTDRYLKGAVLQLT